MSTLVTTALAFTGHRYWSFSRRAHPGLSRESLRFAVVNAVTLGLGLAIVAFVRYPLGQEDAVVLQAANVASIAVGTVIRFLSYRYWVFPARRPDDRPAPADGADERGRSRLRRADPPPLGRPVGHHVAHRAPPAPRVGPAVAKSSAFVTRPSQESTSAPAHEEAVRTTT